MSRPFNGNGPQHGVVARFLDGCLERHVYVVSVANICEATGISAIAAKRQLERLKEKTKRLPGRPTSYLLVPPHFRGRGGPPMQLWLDDYFKIRGQAYYVGLSTASAIHSESPFVDRFARVVVDRPLRSFSLGKARFEFVVKANLSQTPRGYTRYFAKELLFSSPDATAIDLITFQSRLGGIVQASDMIARMGSTLTVEGMRIALLTAPSMPVRQRLGYIVSLIGLHKIAQVVKDSVSDKLATVPAQAGQKSSRSLTNPEAFKWRVADNVGLAAHHGYRN